jgi:polyisoprenoid-binding protein YceI
MGKKIVVVVLVVVGLGFAGWWLFGRSDTPAELSVESDSTQQTSPDEQGDGPSSLDGAWTVEPGGDTVAGFRITETIAGGLADHTAVGRSPEVSGSIEVSGDQVTAGSFTVDLTALEFTDDPGLPVANRKRAMEDRGLETNTYPDATFELTQPVTFDGDPLTGDTVTAEVTGELTLHGVTNEVTFRADAKLDGATLRIATTEPVPIVLADYDITAPTGGPIAQVADEGSFEFLVVLTQG